MRNRYKSRKHYPGVVTRTGTYYTLLRELCRHNRHFSYDHSRFEDIFQDTIVFVASDDQAARQHNSADFVQHFLRRFRMVEFQTVKDTVLLCEVKL